MVSFIFQLQIAQTLVFQRKFSRTRKFTLRGQLFGRKFDFEISGVDCMSTLDELHFKMITVLRGIVP